MPSDSQIVFISYAWGGESELVANELDQAVSSAGIKLIRDKRDLGFKGLIKEFMEKIGQGNAVILIISDKYLKSPNCMFELLEVQKSGDFYERIFPLVLPDANIYKSLGIISYLKYWEDQIDELNEAIKELDSFADTQGIRDDIDLFTDIRGAIAKLASTFRNMNTLTISEMKSKSFAPLLELLGKKVSKDTKTSSKSKYGKVLYHIPELMQIQEWTRCIVRLAWDELLLNENLTIPEEEKVIEDIRLGQVMQVGIEEGRDGNSFQIKSLSSKEQIVLEDDYTEWLFDVKAIHEGSFTLVLRITLLQIIEGFGERKKDIVLERNVTTKAFAPESLPVFESSPVSLARTSPYDPLDKFQNSLDIEGMAMEKMNRMESSTPEPAGYAAPTPFPEVSSPKRKTTVRKIMPFAASIAMVVVAGGIFLSQPDELSSTTDGAVALEENHIPDGAPIPSPIEEVKLPNTSTPPPIPFPSRILVAITQKGPNAGTESRTLLFYTSVESADSLAFDSLEVSFYFEDEVDLPKSTKVDSYSAKEILDSVKNQWLQLVQPQVMAAPTKTNN